MKDTEGILAIVDREIAGIGDSELVERVRAILVRPYSVQRKWDYGMPDESFSCWTILEDAASNTGIAFCSQGLIPTYPWGIVFLSGPHISIGMDCSWYKSLEDAMRESPAWERPNPEGYETQ